MAENEEQASSFLNALISESDINGQKHTVSGKSVGEIINDSHYLSNNIRCVCGVHAGTKDLVQCSICSMYLHRSCIGLPDNFDESTYVCPFCMFQNYSIDPLARLGNAFEGFNAQIQNIYSIFKRLESLERQIKVLADLLSKPGLPQPQRIVYDEKFRQILSEISNLHNEWKEKVQIVKNIQTTLHSIPSGQQN